MTYRIVRMKKKKILSRTYIHEHTHSPTRRCVKFLVGDTVYSSIRRFCPQSKQRCVKQAVREISVSSRSKMPSQEEIRICEPVDNLNHIFSYENDLKLQLHCPTQCHQNGLAKQPSSQLNKGSTQTDNYNSHKNTHQINSEAVCIC